MPRSLPFIALAAALVAAPLTPASAAATAPTGTVDVRHLACPPGTAFDRDPSDVPPGSTFRLEVRCLLERGISLGSSSSADVTRSEDFLLRPLPD